MVTLRQFEIFTEVVRAGSFRRCGEHLGMSQVAVSEHVRALEAQWGVSLFDRRPGASPTLTAKGELVYDRLTVILADIADLARDVSPSEGASRRQISAAIHTFLMRDLQPTLSAFQASHNAALEVDLGVYKPEELLERINRRDLDLAYFFTLRDDDIPQSRFVRSEPLAIFVGPNHPFASRESVTLSEIAQEPAVQLTKRDPFHDMIDRAFRQLGVAKREVGLETDEFGLIISSVHRSQGYACLFTASADQTGNVMGLVPVKLEQQLPPLQVRLLHRRAANRDRLLGDFIKLVEASWEKAAQGQP